MKIVDVKTELNVRSFPNLAGVEGCDDTVRAELEEAGIRACSMEFMRRQGEVPTAVFGEQGMWGFQRAWRYWIAKGPWLPPDVAERLHETHGTQVRVDGHCGCPSPREWFKGFAVGLYHVDTQEGLNALAAALRSVYDPSIDPDATPRTGGRPAQELK